MCKFREEHLPTSLYRTSLLASVDKHQLFLSRVLKKLTASWPWSSPLTRPTNRELFASRRREYGDFFGDYNKFLTLGKRIKSGAEGDILEAIWRCDDGCHYDVVVKVFTIDNLRVLSIQMLQAMAEFGYDSFPCFNNALIYKATLLKDGRFALVIRRYSRSLEDLIEHRLKARSERGEQGPPFLNHEVMQLMLEIANGMNILHMRNILHRDLKPSNVLTLETTPLRCYVADFECDGVIGTGFYRSPEVLRGLTGMEDAHSEIITSYQKESDVYSFGMTCYMICTGIAPFPHLGLSRYAVVLQGHRPVLPADVDSQVRALICRCWHSVPCERPSFGEIVDELKLMMRSQAVFVS